MSNPFDILSLDGPVVAPAPATKPKAAAPAAPVQAAPTRPKANRPAKAQGGKPSGARPVGTFNEDISGAPGKRTFTGNRDKPVPYTGRNREKDRHESGNGKIAGRVTRGGAGKFNLGTIKDDIKAKVEAPTPVPETPVVVPQPEEEPDNSKSFDQYQAELASQREGSLFAVVKEDTSKLREQFANAKRLVKSDDEEDLFLLGKNASKKK